MDASARVDTPSLPLPVVDENVAVESQGWMHSVPESRCTSQQPPISTDLEGGDTTSKLPLCSDPPDLSESTPQEGRSSIIQTYVLVHIERAFSHTPRCPKFRDVCPHRCCWRAPSVATTNHLEPSHPHGTGDSMPRSPRSTASQPLLSRRRVSFSEANINALNSSSGDANGILPSNGLNRHSTAANADEGRHHFIRQQSFGIQSHGLRRVHSHDSVIESHGEHDGAAHEEHEAETMSVVSVTEGQLSSVFEFLTHYFVAMYFLETCGQAFTLLIELVVKLGSVPGPCFESMMLLLDLVFLLLLIMDVSLSVYLAGLNKFMQKLENKILMYILVLSAFVLAVQVFSDMPPAPMLIIDVAKNVLRAFRVVVFFRKLRVVLNSPLSHWDVHSDILQNEEHH